MVFPTKAKITALVCKGLNLPKLNHGILSVMFGNINITAKSNPTSIPTTPKRIAAYRNFLTILLS